MPNKNTHVFFGTAAGAIYASSLSRDQETNYRIFEFIGGCLGGYVGSRLPDIINPANHSGHRAFAHSYLIGTVSAVSANEMTSLWVMTLREMADYFKHCRHNEPTSDIHKDLCLLFEILMRIMAGIGPGLFAGYISHLALDATTQRSLPLA